MLCPEIWNFPSPPSSISIKNYTDKLDVLKTLENQYFTHHISLTLPNTTKVHQNFMKILLEDSQFYNVLKVPAAEFFKEYFIDSFIRNGCLTALSIKSNSERNDFFMITPNRKAVLVLSKVTYSELESLQGDIINVYQNLQRICVLIDLSRNKSNSQKTLKQIYKKLKSCSFLSFDMIIAWKPHITNICPSSIAYYFTIKSFRVKTCEVQYKQRYAYNLAIPHISEDSDVNEIVEWIGAFNLNCDLPNESYLSTMKLSENYEVFGQILHLSFTGLFNVNSVKKVVTEIINMISNSSAWINLVVQSFKGCHVKYENKNYFQTSSDHLYSIFFHPRGSSVVYMYEDYKFIFN